MFSPCADADAALPDVSEVGGKGLNLARMRAAGRTVPAFVVLRAVAFDRLALGDGGMPGTEEEAERRRAAVRGLDLPAGLRAEVLSAVDRAGMAGKLLAVRSSAVDEDGAGASWAGQFHTVLGVRAGADGAGLWDAVREVWASAFTAHAAEYAARRGGAGISMAVVLQEMVDAAVAGVAFSADPVSGDRGTVVLSAVYGLGEGLVSGEVDADTYRVSLVGGEPRWVAAALGEKDRAVWLGADGGKHTVPVPHALRGVPALSDDEARHVAAAACALQEEHGQPQDVEWALLAHPGADPADRWARAVPGPVPRTLVLLQTRPVTALGTPAAADDGGSAGAGTSFPAEGSSRTPALGTDAPHPPRPPARARSGQGGGERRIWDNSNIVESYGGVTLPLTFSFARSVYEEVYLQFCRVMGVSERLLEEHRAVFARMLGLHRGRVYYNLLHWYRVLSLLPGYAFNRGFMERMMGVREKLADPPEAPAVAGRWEDLARMAGMAARLVREQRALKRRVPAFHARVDAALLPLAAEELERWPADRLAALYRRLEGELLRQWKTPLVNDFFAMIAFGVLGKMTEGWMPGAPPTLVNDLLCGEGGIVSTEPARALTALARRVAGDAALAAAFAAEPDDAALWRRTGEDPALAGLHRELRAYLDRYGERCSEELKLETVTPARDPSLLVGMVRALAAPGGDPIPAEGDGSREREIRAAAEARVRGQLRGYRLRVYRAVLAETRRRVRDRENLRFERTRVFGVVRRIFLALGARFVEAGRLEHPRDIFYLSVEEVFAEVEGAAVADPRRLVEVRRAEWDAYRNEAPLPERFETEGPPAWAAVAAAAAAAPHAGDPGGELRGTGCCPGVVRAPVRVVRDPRAAGELRGHVLVAERTDPGWTLLFPRVAGLLVERGSLLSHSAIVAREMGIPCVVSVPGLLSFLRDGDVVEMDGATGTIRRVEAAGPGEGGG